MGEAGGGHVGLLEKTMCMVSTDECMHGNAMTAEQVSNLRASRLPLHIHRTADMHRPAAAGWSISRALFRK